jgi:hypothetical protein
MLLPMCIRSPSWNGVGCVVDVLAPCRFAAGIPQVRHFHGVPFEKVDPSTFTARIWFPA